MCCRVLTLFLLLLGFWPSWVESLGGVFELRILNRTEPRLRICVKHYQVSIDPNPPCYIGEAYSDNNQTQFSFEFKFRWPGTFSLIIETWATQNGTEFESLKKRVSVQQFGDIGLEWNRRTYNDLTYEYRIICLPDYYGDSCDVFCKSRNDKFGHYFCDRGGEIRCLEGWSGDYCERALCTPGCHSTHGFCSEPFSCECHSGWEGPLCSECIRYPGCKHGTCQKQWECECQEGWGGLFCNQDLNYCTNHKPCRNGGTCFNTGQGSYTCSCPLGFEGQDCEIRVTCGECNNGGTCRENKTSSFCQCPEGFTGINCETRLLTCAEFRCRNGGTCSNDGPGMKPSCACPPGYGGLRCEIQICVNCTECHCQNGFCNSDGKCVCNPGFTDPQCSTAVNLCSMHPCANGGKCISYPNSFRCECVGPFKGLDCSEPCNCLNNAPCVNGVCLCKEEAQYGVFCNETMLSRIIEEELTPEHIILVITVSISIPLLVIISVAIILIVKKRRKQEQVKNDELARVQNELNTVQCLEKKFSSHMILNSLNPPKFSNLDLIQGVEPNYLKRSFSSSSDLCPDKPGHDRRISDDHFVKDEHFATQV